MTESVKDIVFNLEQPIFEARSLAHGEVLRPGNSMTFMPRSHRLCRPRARHAF